MWWERLPSVPPRPCMYSHFNPFFNALKQCFQQCTVFKCNSFLVSCFYLSHKERPSSRKYFPPSLSRAILAQLKRSYAQKGPFGAALPSQLSIRGKLSLFLFVSKCSAEMAHKEPETYGTCKCFQLLQTGRRTRLKSSTENRPGAK